ncbi:MAG: T9SS type A sorting domain-containing protein, partial [Flavisolibacter sp.]
YLDRNITIKPANVPTDSVAVRFYFLDKESDSMIKATGCATCTKPTTAYELGVSKYSDPDRTFENGTIMDNQQGIWNFIAPTNVAIVPFDKGYYAEFKVKDFSEFWLNNGGMDKSHPLPVKLLDVSARKQNGNDVVVEWKIVQEEGVKQYEVEFARGTAELQAGHFVTIGVVASLGDINSSRTYSFTDLEPDKFGPRYYRLKIVNMDGSFTYSPIRPVIFEDAILWQVYPNPSGGLFNLVYQLSNNGELYARIVDAKGSLVQEYRKTGNGFPEKLNIDLSAKPGGVYLMQVEAQGKKQSFKLYKL